ncbi:hypothetical protein LZ554_008979 [Drepanopeziza brunnea f. sp. 'monogermtubi']|nr:hypothetical protein LZ554_008979 [Drepanopeziza brunnea f. sp. 'monogermtubi']
MPPTIRCTASFPSASCVKQLCRAGPSSRSFSTSQRHEQRTTRARRGLYRWLGAQGANFLNPLKNSTNYLSAYNAQGQLKRVVEAQGEKQKEKEDEEAKAVKDGKPIPTEAQEAPEGEDKKTTAALPPETARDLIPYPGNRSFVSQPVLGGMVKEVIWFRIMHEGKTVREVSAEFGVEMSRVGAVVRLKEIEKEWERIGKPLANAYDRAMAKMLPKTLLAGQGEKINKHETINDLPVHRATGQQIFHPTSESRHFTRADAAKVFDKKLLPADDRVPHPELAIIQKEFLQELTREEREVNAKARKEAAIKKMASAAAHKAKKAAAVKKVDTGRWEFHFTEVNVDDAGKTGRGHKATGWRYGVPLMDRSRGQIKIPTSVQ